MSLFSFGKKKEEKKAPACCCKPVSGAEKAPAVECCGAPVAGICCVKVLGAGCKSCHTFYENTQAAVRSVGLAVEVEYITDIEKITDYGVMAMPAIVVNEKVVSAGRILKHEQVEKLLKKIGG